MIDPAAFYGPRNPSAGSNNLPGKPTWGPNLLTSQAVEYEKTLICHSPTALAWDQAADARQEAWDRCIFATGFNQLCRLPHAAKPESEEP